MVENPPNKEEIRGRVQNLIRITNGSPEHIFNVGNISAYNITAASRNNTMVSRVSTAGNLTTKKEKETFKVEDKRQKVPPLNLEKHRITNANMEKPKMTKPSGAYIQNNQGKQSLPTSLLTTNRSRSARYPNIPISNEKRNYVKEIL